MTPTSMPSLQVVACSYGIDPARLVQLIELAGSRLGITFHGVVVCNGSHPLPQERTSWIFLRGSNRDLDFSAYHEGARHLLDCGAQQQSTLFLNDSAFSRHNGFRAIKALIPYQFPVQDAEVPAMAGKTDVYDSICFCSPWSGLPVYVSSFCFLLNCSALEHLLGVQAMADADLGAHAEDIRAPTWGESLPMSFRHYLRAHLVYSGNSVSWYQLGRRQGQHELLFKKLRCVYSEHRLSGCVGKHGLIYSVYPTARLQATFFMFEQLAKIKRKWGMIA